MFTASSKHLECVMWTLAVTSIPTEMLHLSILAIKLLTLKVKEKQNECMCEVL